jgi:hypothetical protein
MAILLYLDTLGILLSFVAHLSLLVGVSLPFGKMAIALNVGIGVVLGARLVVTKELRQGKDWFFDKSLKGVCPRWLKLAIGVIIVYGLVAAGFFRILSVGMTTEDSLIADRQLYIGVFTLLMACYALEFLLMYLYNIVRETRLRKLRSEGLVY